MEISFANNKFQRLCEDSHDLKRKYGDIQSSRIIQRINELLSAEDLYDISKLPQARLHFLKGEWKGCFAVDIQHPYRLIAEPRNGDAGDLKSITKVVIIKVIDYH
ncbi:MAG: killer suppression protein HigA [Candidatus Taylorbacteria bacterium]|nr:killer suppression protein HigA [Candidatus Taylorbacteria bacterium]